ncbi:MAG: acylneuraminate cytidylyltransferase family protein [Acidobacteria bacterium]|nr:acylneuraminate cytidylyltransferase family protein [Acidobacteriota bacterium]
MRSAGKVLAIVPARGGSKGIPGKNLLALAGKPLIAYTIDQALATPTVTRLVVSTDSGTIADVALAHGAEVVRRPAPLAGDEAPSESALLHVLDELRAGEGYEPDLVVFLQATSPLRTAADIQQAIATLKREKADSLFSAGPSHGFLWRNGPAGPVPLNYDPQARPRRQEAPEDLVENGSIYVFRPSVLRDLGCRLGGSIAVYRMSALDSWQIDEPADIPIVEFLLRTRHNDQAQVRDDR